MDHILHGVSKSQTLRRDFHFHFQIDRDRWRCGHACILLNISIKEDYQDNIGFPGDPSGKESASQCRKHKRCRLNPWVGKIPWTRKWLHTAVFLPGKPHGQRSLVGYSPWGHKELDISERLRAQTAHNKIRWNQRKRKPKSIFVFVCEQCVNKQHYSSLLDTWS